MHLAVSTFKICKNSFKIWKICHFKKEKLVTMMVFKRKCLTLEQENLK